MDENFALELSEIHRKKANFMLKSFTNKTLNVQESYWCRVTQRYPRLGTIGGQFGQRALVIENLTTVNQCVIKGRKDVHGGNAKVTGWESALTNSEITGERKEALTTEFLNQLRVPRAIDGQTPESPRLKLLEGLLPFLLQKRLRHRGLRILRILGASRHLAVPATGRVGTGHGGENGEGIVAEMGVKCKEVERCDWCDADHNEVILLHIGSTPPLAVLAVLANLLV
ncbi:hypothetical protein FB45DRAFT_863740 [Roridomyces roridus]|uniref:Uncharacterized protein n=1 Tax=Roridomyces roridus TaxID=1738132 RepID=A0AAD7FTV8_9AGAR|nr:hypothetical protein FB45DRAFT_863740 [Roridomyces roridus]